MRKLFAALAVVPCLAYADITGKVIGITDGDTIRVLTLEQKTYKIRLTAIDAPEKTQAFGQVAKSQLSDAVYEKEVTVVQPKKIRNGRYSGKVMLGDIDVGYMMVAQGLAWNEKKYQQTLTPDEKVAYAWQEQTALKNRAGLWADPNPVPPWEYRKRDKNFR